MSTQDFANEVKEVLVRHKSILDIVSKLEESNARTVRSVFKSVTQCGCVKIDAKKQTLPKNIDFMDIEKHMDNHLRGTVCKNCKQVIETEIAEHMFYLMALCNALKIDLDELLKRKTSELRTLGKFNLL